MVNLSETGLTSPSVHHEIIARAHSHPAQLAVKDLHRELTYAQLVDESARIGAGLTARGVVEGDRVALLIPNSVDFVVAALATLWVGAVFVPLAVTDPLARLTTIVADCTPVLVLTSDAVDGQYPFVLSTVASVPICELREDKEAPVSHNDVATRLAYMIYTSGTTGTPKGVQISNGAFAAAVHSTAHALGMNRSTTTLCVSPFHFDGSYANLFPTLVSGGTVIIRSRDALLFPRTFFNTVVAENVTYSGFTPSYLRLLLASPQVTALRESPIEIIALGGEPISAHDLRALWERVPALRIFNRYGPTETTIAVTNVELTLDMIEDGVVTFGQPHAGVRFILLDDAGRVIERANETGELYVGGVQLMDGYWGNPDLTRSVMRDDIVPDEKLYRTGDLVYRDAAGKYVYVDRADRVVKRSGVRISLIELTASMSELSDVAAAACVAFDREGELGIVAFVVTRVETSTLDLRRAASQLIPDNMLPDRIEFVSTMPPNTSNQLDESSLLIAAGLRPFRSHSALPTPTS
jgi:D-alanine--poly(phosphoribitol) ligase subunit 1